jgi:hypothetical protein
VLSFYCNHQKDRRGTSYQNSNICDASVFRLFYLFGGTVNLCLNYLIAFGKPAGHGEVAPREFDVEARERAEEKRRRRRRRRRRKIRKEDEDKAVKRKRLV